MKKIYFLTLMFLGIVVHLCAQPVVADYNILLLESGFGYSDNAKQHFEDMGHTVTKVDASVLSAAYNYSPYDVVIFGFDSNAPTGSALTHLLNENQSCGIGVIMMRGDNSVAAFDMGASATYTNSDVTITNNSHWITSAFSTGIMNMGFTWKTNMAGATSNTTVLATAGPGSALVVHDDYQRVVCPYYGHQTGWPSTTAESLMDRIIAWAAWDCQTVDVPVTNSSEEVALYPNPVGLSLTLSLPSDARVQGNVFDVTGKQVMQFTSKGNHTLNVTSLEEGTYFVRLLIEGEVVIKKMVVQR